MPRNLHITKQPESGYHILVECEDASSLCTFLNRAGTSCSLPREAVFQEGVGVVCEMDFDPRGNDIEDLILDWFGTGTPKDILLSSDRSDFDWDYEPSNIRRYLVSRMQQFTKRYNHQPVRIFIPPDVEAALTIHLIDEGGETAEKVAEHGVRAATPQLFGMQPVFDAERLRLE